MDHRSDQVQGKDAYRLIEDGEHLILETKGYRKGDAQLKAETMRTMWVPGVNNLGEFGQWVFEEFIDVFEIEAGFAKLVADLGAANG